MDLSSETPPTGGFFDANGVELHSGDTVRTIKDLKVGGETIKSGTKVKGVEFPIIEPGDFLKVSRPDLPLVG